MGVAGIDPIFEEALRRAFPNPVHLRWAIYLAGGVALDHDAPKTLDMLIVTRGAEIENALKAGQVPDFDGLAEELRRALEGKVPD